MPQLARDLTTRVQFLMATSELSLFEEVKEKFSPELLWGRGGVWLTCASPAWKTLDVRIIAKRETMIKGMSA
jgi:hypothetical protein